MAATGDLAGALVRLKRALRRVNYGAPLDEIGYVHSGRQQAQRRSCVCVHAAGACIVRDASASRRGATHPPRARRRRRRLRLGEPAAALPLLHHALLDYTRCVRDQAAAWGVQVRAGAQPTTHVCAACEHEPRIACQESRTLVACERGVGGRPLRGARRAACCGARDSTLKRACRRRHMHSHARRASTQVPVKSDEALVDQAFRLARNHLGIATRLVPCNFWARVSTRGRPAPAYTRMHMSCAAPRYRVHACWGRCCAHAAWHGASFQPPLQGMAELKMLFLADLAAACRRLRDAHAQHAAQDKQRAARPVRSSDAGTAGPGRGRDALAPPARGPGTLPTAGSMARPSVHVAGCIACDDWCRVRVGDTPGPRHMPALRLQAAAHLASIAPPAAVLVTRAGRGQAYQLRRRALPMATDAAQAQFVCSVRQQRAPVAAVGLAAPAAGGRAASGAGSAGCWQDTAAVAAPGCPGSAPGSALQLLMAAGAALAQEPRLQATTTALASAAGAQHAPAGQHSVEADPCSISGARGRQGKAEPHTCHSAAFGRSSTLTTAGAAAASCGRPRRLPKQRPVVARAAPGAGSTPREQAGAASQGSGTRQGQSTPPSVDMATALAASSSSAVQVGAFCTGQRLLPGGCGSPAGSYSDTLVSSVLGRPDTGSRSWGPVPSGGSPLTDDAPSPRLAPQRLWDGLCSSSAWGSVSGNRDAHTPLPGSCSPEAPRYGAAGSGSGSSAGAAAAHYLPGAAPPPPAGPAGSGGAWQAQVQALVGELAGRIHKAEGELAAERCAWPQPRAVTWHHPTRPRLQSVCCRLQACVLAGCRLRDRRPCVHLIHLRLPPAKQHLSTLPAPTARPPDAGPRRSAARRRCWHTSVAWSAACRAQSSRLRGVTVQAGSCKGRWRARAAGLGERQSVGAVGTRALCGVQGSRWRLGGQALQEHGRQRRRMRFAQTQAPLAGSRARTAATQQRQARALHRLW